MPPNSSRALAVGISAIATSMDARIDAEIAIAISEYNCPASSTMNSTGANTRIVVNVDASTAGQTLRTPSTAERMRFSPRRRASSMLSMTTMLLSSVIPIANAMPASEMTLIVRPAASRPRNAAIVQIGMPIMPTAVARPERRNRYMTRVARIAPSPRLNQTLRTEASTYPASSAIRPISIPAGPNSSSLSCSTASSIAYLMSITLEPASRLTLRNRMGLPFENDRLSTSK